jgi:hypothetical protein
MTAMLRMLRSLTLAAFALAVVSLSPAYAQTGGGSPVAYLYCYVSGPVTAPTSWTACSTGTPLPVVVETGGGTVSSNIIQWASVTLGAPSAYGTSPGAVTVPGVNSFTTNLPTVAVNVAPVTATNQAVVVDLRPDSPGIIALGQTTMSASVPVTIASDQGGIGYEAPSSAAAAGATPVVCGSAVSSCVLKNAAGNLYAVYANCTSACWLMVFNAASAPSNGSTTAGVAASNMVECVPINAGSVGGLNYSGSGPAVYSTGMTATISSTACATLTLSAVGFIHGMVK